MHIPSEPDLAPEPSLALKNSLDARGFPCPQPLIKTRRLWKTLSSGEQFRVLLDNEIAHTNLIAFLNDQDASPRTTREGDDWIVDAVRTGEPNGLAAKPRSPISASKTQPQLKAAQEPTADYIVVLKSDCMGQGDDDLGRILIKGYINTLRELDNKPSAIVLYNGGAKLAARNSGADITLKALAEEDSVDVIVCGACVDFFEMKDSLNAGRISNMYVIAEKLAAAGHVVYP